MTVSDNYLTDLTACRHTLGSPNFFKAFRIFYYLANIPKKTHNNPLALYIDKHSLTTHFTQVFGLANSEIAVRFFNMIVDTDIRSPAAHPGCATPKSQCTDPQEFNNNLRNDQIGLLRFMTKVC